MREQLNSELKKSIINKNIVATKTIRLIIAAIKDRDIVVRTEGNQNGIGETDIISLLKKMQKFSNKNRQKIKKLPVWEELCIFGSNRQMCFEK